MRAELKVDSMSSGAIDNTVGPEGVSALTWEPWKV